MMSYSRSSGNNHGWLEKVLMEVQLLQRLSHANLVSYRHVWLENAQISGILPVAGICQLEFANEL